MTEKELKRIQEILTDARAHPDRLTTWENTFLGSIGRGVGTYGQEADLSEKQWEVLTRIERKLFST